MKTAVVTGASGFVGGALVSELLKHHVEVYAVVREESIRKCVFKGCSSVHFITCDLKNIAMLPQYVPEGADVFYHLAWGGVATKDRADAELQLQNALWTVEALQAAHKMNCGRFVCTGSIMEYEAIAETYGAADQQGTGCIYGAGKLAAHIIGMRFARQLGVEFLWSVITNTYGPGERSPRLVNATIRKCLHGEAPRFTAGTQNYDFVYIDDVARALRLIGEKGKPFREYLIGSSQARPLKEFLLEMQAAVAPEIEFQFGNVPFTGINLPLERFDAWQTESDTGFRAKISFSEGCKRTMEWCRQQEIREGGVC